MYDDIRIESFRQAVENLKLISARLDTQSITLHRANELPDEIAMARHSGELRMLKDEQAAIGHASTSHVRQARLGIELRRGLSDVRTPLLAAIAAATERVTIAAGGQEAATASPFVRRHLEMLARHRTMPPPTESTTARLAFLESAWLAVDAAMASLGEIRHEVRERTHGHPRV